MNSRRNQGGYLLVTVVVTLFMIASIAVLLSHDSAISANTSSKELESSRAEYVAAAGMQHALWRAQNNACIGDVTIPDTALGADTYNASMTGAAAGTLVTVSADQDAWIRSDDVTRNNGTTAWNHVRNEAAGTEQVLTRFDISSIAAKAQISSAIAWFHLKAGKTHPQGPINVHEITADWTETGVTWESFAGRHRGARIAMLPAQDAGDVWVAINLAGVVQSWVNGRPNYGILFDTQAEGIHTEYTAREDGTNPPRLEVVIGSGQASPVTIKAKAKLDNGVLRDAKDRLTSAYQPPSTTMLQLGTDPGADAMLDSFYERNYGGSDYIQINADPGFTQRPVLRFDLGGIPAGARVVSAILEMRLLSLSVPGTATAHELTRSFVEGTKAGGGTADGATWGTYDGTGTWANAGGDFSPAVADETTISSTDTWVSWDISGLVQKWMAGEPNYGLLLQGANGLDKAKFASREDADPALHPKLTISYACECGNACMAPRGSGNILMVVRDATNMWYYDIQKKGILESWGYTVNIIDDDASQADYDAGVAANDVAYVSEPMQEASLNTKLSSASIGVVSDEGRMNDEFGIAASYATPVLGREINVSDTSHYITSVFPAGAVEIYSADMEGLTVSGSVSPDLQALADWGGATSLAALEAGAQTVGGGNSPGRRVMLPFGRQVDSNVNWDRLNSNGRLIAQRAIEWAMGADKGSSGKILLVVGNAGAPVQKDTDRRDLFESWGYSVTLIDDGASQADLNEAAAENDVVYVTASIGGGALADKLTGSPTPIVNEFYGKLDNFGFSSNTGNTVTANLFTTTNAAHFISEPFGGAGVTQFTANITMPVVSGTLAPGLQSAAELGTLTWALPTLETGAERWDGQPAPARRVHLPFGAADISQLTADGQTLMKRSIEWAGGAGPQYLPIAHWKLDDGMGLIAFDSVGGHDGTLTNGPVWVAGQLGDALQFDGDNDYVEVPHDDTLSLTQGMTFSAWINAQTLGSGYMAILSKDDPGDGQSNYWFGSRQGEIVFGFWASGAFRTVQSSGLALQADTWYHLTTSFDNTTDQVLLYLDGSLVHTASLTFEPTAETAVVLIGTSVDAEDWDGSLDDVRIYDRILSDSEIEDLFAAGGGGLSGAFLDEFNAISYDGNDGTLDWSNEWQETGESDGPGGGDFRVLSNSWCESGNCLQIREDRASTRRLSREADLAGASSATLSLNYRRRHVGIPVGGMITLEISDDGGANFAPLTVYQMDTQDASQQTDIIDVTPYISSNTLLRFSTSNDLFETALYVDNVLIDTTGGGGGGGGGGSGVCFADDFESNSYSGTSGSIDWLTSWVEFGDDNSSSSGDERVQSESGDLALRVRDNDNSGEGVYRDVDLSGFSAATLTLEYRRHNLDTESDWVAMQVSSDAGETWSLLGEFHGPGSDDNYQTYSHVIGTPLTATSRIRLITSSTMGGQDVVYFDNIEICDE